MRRDGGWIHSLLEEAENECVRAPGCGRGMFGMGARGGSSAAA
jgi:hypothetical protein